jgi:hypothetical protein
LSDCERPREVERYTKAADQMKLARAAMVRTMAAVALKNAWPCKKGF